MTHRSTPVKLLSQEKDTTSLKTHPHYDQYYLNILKLENYEKLGRSIMVEESI